MEDAPPESVEARPLKLHILRIAPIVVILGLLVHFLLPRVDNIEDSLETLRSMPPWAILIALAMETLSYLANGALLQSIVELNGDRISPGRAIAIELGAGSVALVAAGAIGFGAAIYKWTRAAGVTAGTAMLASWLPSLFDGAALMAFALLSGIELLLLHRLSRLTVTALAIVVSVLSIVIAGSIMVLARNAWMRMAATFAARLVKRVRRGFDESRLIRAAESAGETWQRMRAGGWLRPACCSLLYLTFDLLCLRYSFLAAGQVLSVSLLIAGYGVPLLLGRASFVPGGIAVIEVAMAALFTGLGVPAHVAVIGVLTYRLFSFWLPALIGIPIAATLHSRRKQQSAT